MVFCLYGDFISLVKLNRRKFIEIISILWHRTSLISNVESVEFCNHRHLRLKLFLSCEQ